MGRIVRPPSVTGCVGGYGGPSGVDGGVRMRVFGRLI